VVVPVGELFVVVVVVVFDVVVVVVFVVVVTGRVSGIVTVVMPCGPLVVVMITRRFVVVVTPGWVVVTAVVGAVVIVVGSSVIVSLPVGVMVVTPGAGGSGLFAGLAVFVFALTAATVARIVARPTPDADRMTSARAFALFSGGGAICPRSGESVTGSVTTAP
jgi:hypothetical protein